MSQIYEREKRKKKRFTFINAVARLANKVARIGPPLPSSGLSPTRYDQIIIYFEE
jgi:hypothetical protein